MKHIGERKGYYNNSHFCGELCDEEKCTCKDLTYSFLKRDGSRYSFQDTSYESASKRAHHSDTLQSITK